MVDTEAIYQEILKYKIKLDFFPLPTIISISHMDESGNCYIGVDFEQLEKTADIRVRLAHETGHCVTGAFYNRHSDLNWVGQQEHKADLWATKKLIPWDKLEDALHQELVEVWQLAEYFDVTEDFVRRTLTLYAEKGLYQAP